MDEPILDSELEKDFSKMQNVEYAGFWIRVAAALLDALILLPLTFLTSYNFYNQQSIAFMILLTLIAAMYKPILEWRRAATFGKQIVGIKVVDENMDDISGGQAFQRYFPWIIMYVFSIMTNIFLFENVDFSEIEGFNFAALMQISEIMTDSPYATISQTYNIIFLLIVLFVAFDKKSQGLHDKFAKTYCIIKK